MINFDEEIKKFQPSLEVDETEDAIYNGENMDVTDVINKVLAKIPVSSPAPQQVPAPETDKESEV